MYSKRIEVARLLSLNMPYTEIVNRTGASSTTISRVSKCLTLGDGGYAIVLGRMGEKEDV